MHHTVFQFVSIERREIFLCMGRPGMPPAERVGGLRAYVTQCILVPSSQIRLYKASLSYEEAEGLFDTSFDVIRRRYQQLNARDLISEIWPNGFDQSRVDVIVQEITDQRPNPSIMHSASYGATHLATIQESTIRYLNRLPPPSQGARIGNFIATQGGKHPIRNGRSLQNAGRPVSLHHKIFDDFLAVSRGPPSAEYLKSAPVYEFICASRSLYSRENLRVAALEPLLNKMLGFTIFSGQYGICRSDLVVQGGHGSYLLVSEWDNELGTGESDPSMRSALSYSRYWSQDTVKPLREASCCPSFILAVAGPWMCVLGATFLESVIVQPLTDFIWMGPSQCLEDGVYNVARVFEALSVCLKSLDSYYNALVLEAQPSRFFPWLSRFLGPSGREVYFRYIRALGGPLHERKAVFLAETLEDRPRKVVVKFTTRYNTRAHRLMKAHDFAPELYFDSSEHPTFPHPSNLVMIVMDFVIEAPLGSSHSEAYATLVAALDILHKEKLAFGDLRPPNILVPEVRSFRPPRAVLVDFDWCGESGKDCYPRDINMKDIRWADGVSPGAFMVPDHDRFMFEELMR